ncbi:MULTISPECIES: bssS family protein [Citrobacter]|jgi:biofilm regulator BssS|uniref:BssS family protein n=1 Tax=Citrobacter freundii TaxID=546 RepID=A0AAN4JC09_CITFR|nr:MULTISPECIES: bssS family protein [Citrobacter]EKU6816037.1 bssS family protein [Citrobacter freundii]EKW2107561.1 bssS family protein [Citrobacter freundii]ELK7552348.1 bssS family protein [Citrobacter freundii]MBA7943181.1 bssS family protein [Citrobacter sp. RHBSTW-00271]MBE0071478.1 bssS family protein [Citrobacter freundii]
MSQKDDIPVFPVTGWQAGVLPWYGTLALKLQYLPSPIQAMEMGSKQEQETHFFALTPEMAESLISDLQRHIQNLRNSAGPRP